MRAHVLSLGVVAGLVLLSAVASNVSAAGDCDQSADLDAAIVKVVVEYGGACVNGDVYTCTLSKPDPDYPSTPVWQCKKFI